MTTSQIIDVLKERGLSIEDENAAVHYLEHISYFRFAAYLRHMETDTKLHTYKETATFDKARSFGCLVKLYNNFNDVSVKKKIAKDYGVPQHEIMESWMISVNVIRNICAHHGRVWNRIIPVMPQLPKTLKNSWIVNKPQTFNKLYSSLCCIAYWLNSINPNNNFVSNLKSLLKSYSNVDPNAMGFNKNWEQEPLWNTSLEFRVNSLE